MTTFSTAKNPPSLHEVKPYCVRVHSRSPTSTAYLIIILLPKWQVRRGTSVLLARRSFENDHEKDLLCTQHLQQWNKDGDPFQAQRTTYYDQPTHAVRAAREPHSWTVLIVITGLCTFDSRMIELEAYPLTREKHKCITQPTCKDVSIRKTNRRLSYENMAPIYEYSRHGHVSDRARSAPTQ